MSDQIETHSIQRPSPTGSCGWYSPLANFAERLLSGLATGRCRPILLNNFLEFGWFLAILKPRCSRGRRGNDGTTGWRSEEAVLLLQSRRSRSRRPPATGNRSVSRSERAAPASRPVLQPHRPALD